MKTILWIIGVIIILGIGFFALNNYIYNEKQEVVSTVESTEESNPVTVTPISHATAILEWADTAIYTDPTGTSTAFAGKLTADIILVTDIHSDHLSTSTLNAVVGDATLIVPQAVKDLLPQNLATRVMVLENGESIVDKGFTIQAVPMYNLPESADSRHAKGRGNGYIIERDGFRVYIAGDTAGTPEMRALPDIDIAFIPMNLPFTMDVNEAADAVLAFKPKQVYPYHYRGQNGLSDVNKFKELVNTGNPDIEVILANWYPQQ